jgi:GDSL-like Lipase/Acylhydrolase family
MNGLKAQTDADPPPAESARPGAPMGKARRSNLLRPLVAAAGWESAARCLPPSWPSGQGRRAVLCAGVAAALAAALTAAGRPAKGKGGETAMAKPGSGTTPARHVVLLGDSSLDNGAYVGSGPDVLAQLGAHLPPGWRATRAAVDGAVAGDVARQLDRGIPPDASHLVVSVGGNDALRQEHVLGAAARSVADALDLLAGVRERFARDYRAMLDLVLARRLPTAVCTIYEPRFPDPRRRRVAAVGLAAAFNDVITREAFARGGLALIDLRLVCDRDEDFANPIEPSVRGGEKIAAAIADAVLAGPAAGARGRRSEVFAG